MCLCGHVNATQDFLQKHKGKKFIKVYKVLRLGKSKYYSKIYKKKWNIGVNKSNSRRKIYPITRDQSVGNGLHVYLDKKRAINELPEYNSTGQSFVVVEFKAYLKDLVAIEQLSYRDSPSGEAVFIKLDAGKKFKVVAKCCAYQWRA